MSITAQHQQPIHRKNLWRALAVWLTLVAVMPSPAKAQGGLEKANSSHLPNRHRTATTGAFIGGWGERRAMVGDENEGQESPSPPSNLADDEPSRHNWLCCHVRGAPARTMPCC
ncbi:hypothetical protein QBC47DRAFT_401933 [Echria macrotheca]|uniref:Secreted protein n=1 Tax=Echria macrotheca TaxID=438768 RepID=A0AAJ0BCI6_9PEZI|nr:hypothetical protein QBC47DRAFT_401933 [Echria macrotheca]